MLQALLLPLLFIELSLLTWFGYNLFQSDAGWLVAFALPLAIALGWRVLLVTAQFLLAGVPHRRWRQTPRALAGEYLWQLWLYTFGHPLRGRPFAPASTGSEGPVIVLVHGFLCNAGLWRGFARKLRRQGFDRLYAFNLDPLYRDTQARVLELEQHLRDTLSATGATSAVVIGHSMGGVLARMLLARKPELVAAAIAIGAPHHGTRGALWIGGGRERGPPSPHTRWLQQFNSEFPLSCGLLNIWSETDNIVWPQHSARVEGAEELKLDGYGHLHLLRAPAVLDSVVRKLRSLDTAHPETP